MTSLIENHQHKSQESRKSKFKQLGAFFGRAYNKGSSTISSVSRVFKSSCLSRAPIRKPSPIGEPRKKLVIDEMHHPLTLRSNSFKMEENEFLAYDDNRRSPNSITDERLPWLQIWPDGCEIWLEGIDSENSDSDSEEGSPLSISGSNNFVKLTCMIKS